MAQKNFNPGISSMNTAAEEPLKKEQVEEIEYTPDETRNQMLLHEEDIIQGLIDAADYGMEEHQPIEIVRNGKVYFRFRIRPLTERDYNKCRKDSTQYSTNRHLGIRLPKDTDNAKYRSALIYRATVEEDRAKLWDNKKVWEALRDKDYQIMNGLDVIEFCLKAGEKDKIIEAIDNLSGFEEELEEVAKN